MKKEVSQQDFIDGLLAVRQDVEDHIVDYYKKGSDIDPAHKGDERGLRFEAKIFSFWLLAISVPVDRDFLDLLHATYCKYVGLNSHEQGVFYGELGKRYQNYYDSYNFDIKQQEENPKTFWPSIGRVIVEVVKKQNTNFSFKNDLPIVGAIEVTMAYTLFVENFKFLVETVGKFREEFDIDKYLILEKKG